MLLYFIKKRMIEIFTFVCFVFQLCFVSEQPTNYPSFSRTSISNPPLPLNQRPILSQTKKKQTNFSIFVVSREWPGHQVLLVLTDFFNFSRNDATGEFCRRAPTGGLPSRGAHIFKKRKNGKISANFREYSKKTVAHFEYFRKMLHFGKIPKKNG